MWIKCDEQHEDYPEPDGASFDIPDLKEHMGLVHRHLGRSEFWKNIVRSRELQQPFEMWMRSNFTSDGSNLNQNVIAATKGAMAYDWRGPTIALKYIGHGGMYQGNAKYADMNMQDFRDAVDFLTYYTDEEAWSKYWTGKRQ